MTLKILTDQMLQNSSHFNANVKIFLLEKEQMSRHTLISKLPEPLYWSV